MKALILVILLAATSVFAAANQSITCGDGVLRWEAVQTYYLEGVPVGIQTNALTWQSDNSGCGVLMTLDQQVWFGSTHLYDSFTALDPHCGNGITWRVDTISPWDFLAGLYDSITATSMITWSNHLGTVGTFALTSNPDIDPHSVWLDWVKSKAGIEPRITFDSEPKRFNQVLAPGNLIPHNKQPLPSPK